MSVRLRGLRLCALRSVEGCDAMVSFAIVQPEINDEWGRVEMVKKRATRTRENIPSCFGWEVQL